MKNSFTWNGKTHEAGIICDIMHMETAQPLAVYDSDFYAGTPVLSANAYGKGHAYYVATRSDKDFYADFLQHILDEQKITPVYPPCEGVEITERDKDGKRFLFFLNHNDFPVSLPLETDGTSLLENRSCKAGTTLQLPPKGAAIYQC